MRCCGLGELLRTITFVGDGYGCYENFDVRTDATRWSEERLEEFLTEYTMTRYKQSEGDDENDGKFISSDDIDEIRLHAKGYTFTEDELTVDVFWHWDGDGTLVFRVSQDGKVKYLLVNDDCKHDNYWKDISPTDPEELEKFNEVMERTLRETDAILDKWLEIPENVID